MWSVSGNRYKCAARFIRACEDSGPAVVNNATSAAAVVTSGAAVVTAEHTAPPILDQESTLRTRPPSENPLASTLPEPV